MESFIIIVAVLAFILLFKASLFPFALIAILWIMYDSHRDKDGELQKAYQVCYRDGFNNHDLSILDDDGVIDLAEKIKSGRF